MILGVGTDIVAVARLQAFWERHGERGLDKILAPVERVDFARAAHPGRFLAKRWAAKEALAKALGTGVRPPATLPNIAVEHDVLGKPTFTFLGELAPLMQGRMAHLSLSDEAEYAVAYVILEQR